MEKLTKKTKKKSRRIRRRIGVMVIGGLSLVLTVCLSVGATLAWFAGSTWASNSMYMGGPVYVEMSGTGNATEWKGGSGNLTISAVGRTTGTVLGAGTPGSAGPTSNGNILLPGQQMQINSYARVFSTAYQDDTSNATKNDLSSGGNSSNIGNKNANNQYLTNKGKIYTTTSSVLRAKFSIDIEFDPTVGFNNFTSKAYADNYPVQGQKYTGESTALVTDPTASVSGVSLEWYNALGAPNVLFESAASKKDGRRDAVRTADGTGIATAKYGSTAVGDSVAQKKNTDTKFIQSGTAGDPTTYEASESFGTYVAGTTTSTKTKDLYKIHTGDAKSIYKWRYVSETEYNKAFDKLTGADATGSKSYETAYEAGTAGATAYVKMGAPFDGTVNSLGNPSANAASGYNGTGNGFYGVWVVEAVDLNATATPSDKTDDTLRFTESDAFYKARTKAYMESYVEYYINENDNTLSLTTASSLTQLEEALNKEFVTLVNKSSDIIFTHFHADAVTGSNATPEVPGATWLYVDPKIGNDTNAGDSATTLGGWWYLVESIASGEVKTVEGGSLVKTQVDDSDLSDGVNTINNSSLPFVREDYATDTQKTEAAKQTGATIGMFDSDDEGTLNAKLYEVKPDTILSDADQLSYANGSVKKVVSYSFPFVNGYFSIPPKTLTNIFANAKITFKITFQALQAFFPFTESIDAQASGSQLAGKEKALNIKNAIPIYNEAFEYLASFSVND